MQIISKKIIHLCIIIVIIVAIIFTALMFALKYNESGEINMPFKVSKIGIISTVDAQDVDNNKKKWSLEVNQDNDIYIYIEKNEEYEKTETIKNVTINNINITKAPTKGNITIYKPSSESTVSMFKNMKDNEATQIDFKGEKKTDIKNLQISNQGGIVAFRCANNNLGIYTSDYGKEVNYDSLLQKLKINNEELKSSIEFDITIELNSNKSFNATFSVDFPADNIVEKGKTEFEITDLDDIVFKRNEN